VRPRFSEAQRLDEFFGGLSPHFQTKSGLSLVIKRFLFRVPQHSTEGEKRHDPTLDLFMKLTKLQAIYLKWKIGRISKG